MMPSLTVPIRFSDYDVFGHVNHVRVLGYCQDHRTMMFSALDAATGETWSDAGFVVGRLEADYRHSIALGSIEAVVDCTVEKVGRTSVALRYRISVRDVTAVEVFTVLVRTVGGVSTPISEAARTWLVGRST